MRHAVRWSVKGLAVLAAVAALVAVLSLAVMLLWNSLVPELFRGPSLQYWQALSLLLLSLTVFGVVLGEGNRSRNVAAVTGNMRRMRIMGPGNCCRRALER